ncbi:hypothetical protein C8034_v008446 [Colletotrichum sidae]|uniref:Uncharacterized protein n=1 Tax=Colletotrichum sidae TaxID=1347389 RepID=A0A4R8Q112_9PEZI|nr:hypothetical protein C8034_v008446 [Colletotrichum sidae]
MLQLHMPRLRRPQRPPIPPIPRISQIPRKNPRKSQKQQLQPFQSIRIPTATHTAAPQLRRPRLHKPRLRKLRLHRPRLHRPRLRYGHAYATLGPSRPHEKEKKKETRPDMALQLQRFISIITHTIPHQKYLDLVRINHPGEVSQRV